MEALPFNKMNTQARSGNPIVAKAKKDIPGRWHKRWDKTKKFIKKHQKTIYLTLEGLGAFALAYWYYRRGLMKVKQEYYEKTADILKSHAEAQKNVVDMATKSTGMTFDSMRKAVAVESEHKVLAGRVAAIEQALKDPRFHDFLKKKHGISDLKKV